jgi:hypothetical protein
VETAPTLRKDLLPLRRCRVAALAAVLLLLLPAAAAQAATAQPTLVSAIPVAWTPQVLDGAVKAFAQAGGTMVAGGSFHQVREPADPTLTQPYLFSFDAADGEIDQGFQPVLDGEVRALVAAPDGHSVYVGGTFTSVDGVAQPLLARIDLDTGALDPDFRPQIEGEEVDSLVLSGGRLYVGGAFGKVGGLGRSRFAVVDPTTGAVDPDIKVTFGDARSGLLKVTRLALSPDGAHMMALGTFLTVDGLRRPQIAMLDVSADGVSVSSWATEAFAPACGSEYSTDLRDVDFSPDGSYFVVVATGGFHGGPAAPVLCDSASRWETSAAGPDQKPTWVDYTGGDSLTAVAATGTAVYVGGHQRWLNRPLNMHAVPGPGAVPRPGIAALDPVNGLPFSWNPGKTRGKAVFALLATDQGLWVGSDTTGFAGRYRPRLAMVPLAGGATVPAAAPGTLPGQLYRMGLTGGLIRHSFDGRTLGRAEDVTVPRIGRTAWSHVRGAFMLSGRLYAGTDRGTLVTATFDGRHVGPASTIALRGIASSFPVARITGMFYDAGRLYYTLSGDPRLFYRYFEPQSRVVGALRFVAAGGGWRHVRGMTLAGGEIYFATSAGAFKRVAFAGGRVVPDSTETLRRSHSGMVARGLFVLAP